MRLVFMRRLVLLSILLSAAGPAVAQDAAGWAALQMREMDLNTQQDLNRARAIDVENQLQALDAKVQTNQRLQDLQTHGLQSGLPAPVIPRYPLTPAQMKAQQRYPSIPDDALAASRARIAAASRNRR